MNRTRNAGPAYAQGAASSAKPGRQPAMNGRGPRAVVYAEVWRALELLRGGETVAATAAAVGVSKQAVTAWASGANCADVLREFETTHGPLKLRRGPRPIAR